MYLMICTRPDLGFAIGRLSQYCEEPLSCHWNAVKRVYRYVKGTQNIGIVYDAKSGTSSECPSHLLWATVTPTGLGATTPGSLQRLMCFY